LHVLEAAGIDQAQALAIALPDPMSTRLCVKRALEFAPDLDIVVKANQEKDIELLYQLGAREVVEPDFEASLELSTHLLTSMGLSPLLIQQEVKEIRNNHYFSLRPIKAEKVIAQELQAAMRGMNSKWLNLPDDSPLLGMTLEETNVRRLTGVSVVAIKRISGEEIDYPEGQTILDIGDKVLLVGESSEINSFMQLVEGEIAIPQESTSSQWLTVTENSPIAGKELWQIHFSSEYGITVQAVQRQGKFIRWPNGGTDIQAGDRLLLCGAFYQLNQVRQLVAPKTRNLNLLQTTEIVPS
ncbi:MAG: TrkA C-terminal domain-containing protein, partial [Microcoleaceae cyanobacterium]